MLTRQSAAALAQSVIRVNESPERLKERLDEANAIIDNLRAQNRQLRRELAAYQLGELAPTDPATTITGESINGRPVYTIEAAARAAGMKYHAAYRRVTSQRWEAVQRPDRSWRVYADQSLSR